MALTDEQNKQREGKLTASMVASLMTGDKEKIMQVWRELVGDPNFVREDLSGVWPVQLGSLTESLNLKWYEYKTGRTLSDHGKVITHSNGWAAVTLDAWDNLLNCPVEAKHVGGFEKMDVIIQRYMPQLHWQMYVTGAFQCALSVINGAREPIIEIIPFDSKYGTELVERATSFMEHVRNLTEPVALDPVLAPLEASQYKDYDFQMNNHWVSAAADWVEYKLHAEKFEQAKTTLKDLVPFDAKLVTGGGVIVSRDKASRLKIVKAVDK